MLEIPLKLAADEFVRYLTSSTIVKEFRTAKGLFESEPAIANMRQEYTSLAKTYREKESRSTLTQQDIEKLRAVQSTFNAHPVTVRYSRAQENLVMLLRICNGAISQDIGIDFAATAAPARTC